MTNRLRAPALLLVGVLVTLFASSAAAVPLRFEIAGTVWRADGTGVFEIGDAVDLVIVMDLVLPLVQPDAFNAVSSASGTGTAAGGAITLTSGALTSWKISDGFGFDLVGVGPTLGSSVFEGVEMAPGVFEGADLAAFLALDDSDVRELRLRVRTTIGSGSSPTRAGVTVTSFSVTPEPATALLVALGIFGLGARKKRKPGGW
jgi:hypothetical protein